MDPQDQDRESDRDRRVTNIFLALMFVLIAGGGIWLATAMHDARKADECLTRGSHNCAPIEVPPR